MSARKFGLYLVSATFALLSFCFGPIMPLFQHGDYSARHINLIWDSLYGLGIYAMSFFLGHHALVQSLMWVGFALWPLLLFILIFFIMVNVIGKKWPYGWKMFVILLFILSFAFNISIEESQKPRYRWMPFYETFSNVAY